jgi:hypothetical protein
VGDAEVNPTIDQLIEELSKEAKAAVWKQAYDYASNELGAYANGVPASLMMKHCEKQYESLTGRPLE